jgi:DNA end-binding protein Ku
MNETNMAGVGKFVLWGKENLCLIRPMGDTLALELLFYAEDVRSAGEIEAVVGQTEVKDTELDLARQLIAGLAGEWAPDEFENEYRRDLARMLDAKVAGQEITRPEPVAEAPVVDLMEALRASVAAASARGGGTRKKAPARSSSAPKKTARKAS